MASLPYVPVDARELVAKLREQLPTLIFAVYDCCPLATAGQTDTGRVIPVLAVCSQHPSARLDAEVTLRLRALVTGEIPQPSVCQLMLHCQAAHSDGCNKSEKLSVCVKWQDAVEFVVQLHHRAPRSVEALTCSQPPLYVDAEWADLLAVLTPQQYNSMSLSKEYRIACARSAVGLAQKLKANSGTSRGLVTLAGMCQRAAHGADPALARRLADLESSDTFDKKKWRDLATELSCAASKVPGIDDNDAINEALEVWLERLLHKQFKEWVQNCVLQMARTMAHAHHTVTCDGVELDADWQKRLGTQWPHGAKLVCLAQVGSYLKNLQVPSSDSDYAIVFITPTEQLLGRTPLNSEFHTHAQATIGSDKRGQLEFTGKELGNFVLELAKGDLNHVELLYAENIHTSTPLWQWLRNMRRCFITKRCAKQYLGFISKHLRKAVSMCSVASASMDTDPETDFQDAWGPKVSKCLYLVHHKMLELDRILNGMEPKVALHGEERDYVMRFRLEPLEGPRQVRSLIEDAESKFQQLLSRLEADTNLSEEVDAEILISWLCNVRMRQVLDAGGITCADNST